MTSPGFFARMIRSMSATVAIFCPSTVLMKSPRSSPAS